MGKTKIYLVKNCFNNSNNVYIGKNKEGSKSRESRHKKTYGNKIIYTIIDEIDSLDRKKWKPLETKWILYYKNLGYNVLNINKGGGGPEFASNEMRQKISKANQGKKRTEKTKKKISKSMKGKNVGNILSKESRKKIGDKTKGHIVSQTARNKISKGRKGLKHTNKSKQQISLKLKNIKRTKEFGDKISKTKQQNPYKRIDISSKVKQLTLDNKLIKEWNSITEAKNILKINNISSVCIGNQKTAGGFKWKYIK